MMKSTVQTTQLKLGNINAAKQAACGAPLTKDQVLQRILDLGASASFINTVKRRIEG